MKCIFWNMKIRALDIFMYFEEFETVKLESPNILASFLSSLFKCSKF